jgi:hypothetical protein
MKTLYVLFALLYDISQKKKKKWTSMSMKYIESQTIPGAVQTAARETFQLFQKVNSPPNEI